MLSIKVLIVDDSILFRTKLMLSLGKDKEIKVAGCAASAEEAAILIQTLHPDVITLDVEMPGASGIELLKDIMKSKPLPVVVVSSLPINALDALSAGAVDFVKKPESGDAESSDLFFEKIRSIIKIAVCAKLNPKINRIQSTILSNYSSVHASDSSVIAIGASTGGTEAIIEVVKNLPSSCPGIVIVQHMPAHFTTLYAERLNKICKMEVKEAKDRDRLVPGRIIIGAGSFHLTLQKDTNGYYIRSLQGEKVSGHCPSVDVLFSSVAQTAGKSAIGVILTGMGADGAKGIKQMHDLGCYTIGQDKESCVVYGMPMEAYKLGGISRQLPIDEIGDELVYYLNYNSKIK